MPLLHAITLAAVFILATRNQSSSASAECSDWQQCRGLALQAAERQDFETFHDLTWRAVQKGPRNDTGLMYLLARAQSLSGRPGDALVMLGRLTDMGVATDAATDDDLRRVRALTGWPELKQRIETLRAAGASAPRPASADTPSPSAVSPGNARPPEPKPVNTSPPTPATERGTGTAGAAPEPAVTDAARFAAFGPPPIGLAYDAVSRRFVVAVRETRKLSVVDEFSHHVATLSGAQAGFDDIAALEIDPHEGNLWVVSSTLPSDGAPAATTLHKLQLVSGRVLSTVRLPEKSGPARFIDVAVSGRNTILALDDAGKRIFRLQPGSQTLEVAAMLEGVDVSSVAPTSDAVVYVAHRQGISRVDLATGAAAVVKATADVDMAGLSRIRWHRGTLVGLQTSGDRCRAVRVTLDRTGRRATAIEPIDASVMCASGTAATVVGDVLYYFAAAEGTDVSVRRVRLSLKP